MIKVKCVSLHYKKINPVCAYEGKDGGCSGPVEYFGISVLTDGTVRARTMCEKHMIGEKDHAISEGMEMAGETSVAGATSDAMLVDPKVIGELAEALGLEAEDLEDDGEQAGDEEE